MPADQVRCAFAAQRLHRGIAEELGRRAEAIGLTADEDKAVAGAMALTGVSLAMLTAAGWSAERARGFLATLAEIAAEAAHG